MSIATPTRFIGLDIHKHYLVATGVNAQKEVVFGPQTVQFPRLEEWVKKYLNHEDALVMEMSTNSFQLYDELLPFVHSVILVHPPHVALIVKVQVKTDKKAALTLAQLHAAGLLTGIWIPPSETRELRAILAHRTKLVRLSTQAKNRLHSLLHRKHILPPEGDLFIESKSGWWNELPLLPLEKARMESDWETLRFAQQQIKRIEDHLADYSVKDDRLPYLLQLPGFGLLLALTVLAAIGDISRFPDAKHLVGYAGLGTRVHDSGMTHQSGRITKAGRRDLRSAMVQAARVAARSDPYWMADLAKKEPRMGYQKAIVAIARKLLVVVWQVLAKNTSDRFAQPERVARKFAFHAQSLGKTRRPNEESMQEYVLQNMNKLGFKVHAFKIGKRVVTLPDIPSKEDSDLLHRAT